MSNKKTNFVAATLIGFVALVISVTSVMIYNTPTEVVAGTAGNYSINLTNGGNVLEDEGFLFYTIPGQKGVYRMESNNPKSVKKISDIGDGDLQVVGSGYYFTDDDTLYRIDWEGNKRQVVLKNAINPKIVGSLVFYAWGGINKYSMKNHTDSFVSSNIPERTGFFEDFLVYYKKIYYINKVNGDIYSCSFDGSKRGLFLEANAEKLSVDGQYFFFIEDGMLNSAMLKDKQIIKTEIVKAKSYAIFGSCIVYEDGKKTYFANVDKLLTKDDYTPKVLADAPAKGISIDDENFYFFIDGKLQRISHEGKDLVTLN